MSDKTTRLTSAFDYFGKSSLWQEKISLGALPLLLQKMLENYGNFDIKKTKTMRKVNQ